MIPADRAALEIGRLFMRAHAAEQQTQALAERVAELEAQVKEFTNDALKAEHAEKVEEAEVET